VRTPYRQKYTGPAAPELIQIKSSLDLDQSTPSEAVHCLVRAVLDPMTNILVGTRIVDQFQRTRVVF
jgi:hypothetical protein